MSEPTSPIDPRINDLITRTKVGRNTQEFIRTPTGRAIVERAVGDYRKAISELQEMSFREYEGSSSEELNQYRKISLNLATPLSCCNGWMRLLQMVKMLRSWLGIKMMNN